MGRVTLVGSELHLPYDKPPLSKQFLGGDWDLARVALLREHEAEVSKIDLRLGVAASSLNTEQKLVELADGTDIHYDKLVIATGASARTSPWESESGIHTLRTMDDCLEMQNNLRRGGPVVIIGGGFIGSEVASTARKAGWETILVDSASHPMERVVGAACAQHFTDLHTRHGVQTHFGSGVESISGSAGDLQVTLTDGTTLRAGTVVVGIGSVPNVDWLATSGLDITNGVHCDETGRADNAVDVFVVGDVARWRDGHGPDGTRHEHWTNAVDQAKHVARHIAHGTPPDAFTPAWFAWSDQQDWKIQVIGNPPNGELTRVTGDLTNPATKALMTYADEHGRLVGAVTINWAKMAGLARRTYSAGGAASEVSPHGS